MEIDLKIVHELTSHLEWAKGDLERIGDETPLSTPDIEARADMALYHVARALGILEALK